MNLMDVYDAFLAKVNEDDWAGEIDQSDLEWLLKDWRAFYEAAIPYFKFPRNDLSIDEETLEFKNKNVSRDEIYVIATYMKYEWLKRTVDSWENVKTQYEEKDFSQANLLKTFISLKDQVFEEAAHLERMYYRSPSKKPFNYSRLAGGGVKRNGRY